MAQLIVRVPGAQGTDQVLRLLFILPVEFLNHMLSQVQCRLMVDDDFDHRIVPLIDDGDVPFLLPDDLSGISNLLRVLRDQSPAASAEFLD